MNSFVIVIVALAAVAQATDFRNVKFPVGEGRIVGGEEAVPHAYPYQVALAMTNNNGETFFCGGSLLTKNIVLTAAHCADGIASIEVTLGAHNIREEESTQVKITSTEFIIHEDWQRLTLQNDIALVILPTEVELNENIALTSLPTRADVDNKFVDEMCTVTGWGKDSDSATSVSPVLRHVEVPVISKLKCSLSYPLIIKKTHVCISGRGGKSSCSGDSGGPLVCNNEAGNSVQVGIVSFGRATGCERGFPGVFTRVTEYLDWLQKNAGITIE